ncbi:MAG: type II 3-dehydroquinate dehydratase [Bacteroidia bacterium]|nr:type II 3-dehydroquinate dehydratase [Bacteroidia bacterium]
MEIQIINGPNLNMLGKREPEIYGSTNLDDMVEGLKKSFPEIKIDHFQSNHEGEIVDKIQRLVGSNTDGLVINAASLSHYSYAIFDALNMLYIPKIEVHISQIYQREEFRHKSVTAPACNGVIAGLGIYGYHMAVQWMKVHCQSS